MKQWKKGVELPSTLTERVKDTKGKGATDGGKKPLPTPLHFEQHVLAGEGRKFF